MEQMKPTALKRIQSRLVLEAVAKAEKIEVTDEELNEEHQKMADSYKMEVEKIKELFGEEENEQLKEDIAIRKAVDLIVAEAKEK